MQVAQRANVFDLSAIAAEADRVLEEGGFQDGGGDANASVFSVQSGQ